MGVRKKCAETKGFSARGCLSGSEEIHPSVGVISELRLRSVEIIPLLCDEASSIAPCC